MLRKSEGNLSPNYLKSIEKKTLRTLLIKELVFNNKLVFKNKLVIRDSECSVKK